MSVTISELKNETITEYNIPVVQFYPVSGESSLPTGATVVERHDDFFPAETGITSVPITITFVTNDNDPIDETENTSTENVASLQTPTIKSRKSKSKGINRRLENKMLRMAGKSYVSSMRTNTGKKIDVERSSRTIGPRCNCSNVKAKSEFPPIYYRPNKVKPNARKCNEFSDECRLIIFNKFWDMDWSNRKIYVNSLVRRTSTKRSRKRKDPDLVSRRTFTIEYSLPTTDNICKRVCKKMFLNTLDMKEHSILKWVTGSQYGLFPTKSMNKRPSVNRKEEEMEHLYNWFNDLQKFTTTTGKKRLSKLYVDEKFPTKTHLYRAYKQNCLDEGKTPLSWNTFLTKMKYHNLNFINFQDDGERTIQLFPVPPTAITLPPRYEESDQLSSTQKRINKRNEAKQLRMEGKPYSGYKKTEDGRKIRNERGGRILGPRCACGDTFVRRCKDISDECREKIFERFWELDWPQRKVYVNSLVKRVPIKRRRNKAPESRRKGTLEYSLPLFDNSKMKVCKTMFLHTLGMKETAIGRWVSQTECGVPAPTVRKKTQINSKRSSDFEFLTNWLNMQQKLRKKSYSKESTKKLIYVLPEYTTKTQLYNAYQRFCDENNTKHLSIHTLSVAMDKLNLILPPPEKVKRKSFKTQVTLDDPLDNIQKVKKKLINKEPVNLDERLENIESPKDQQQETTEYETVTIEIEEAKYLPPVETVMYYPTYNPSGFY